MAFDFALTPPGDLDVSWACPLPYSKCCTSFDASLEGAMLLLDHAAALFQDGADTEEDPLVKAPFYGLLDAVFGDQDPQDLFTAPADNGSLNLWWTGGQYSYNFETHVWGWDSGPGPSQDFADVLAASDVGEAGIFIGSHAWKFHRSAGDYDPAPDPDAYFDASEKKSAVRPAVTLPRAWTAADAAKGGILVRITTRTWTFSKGVDGRYEDNEDEPDDSGSTQTLHPTIGETRVVGDWISVTAGEGQSVLVLLEAVPDWDCLGD